MESTESPTTSPTASAAAINPLRSSGIRSAHVAGRSGWPALADHPLGASRDFRALFLGNALVALAQRSFVIVMGWWIVTQAGAGGGPMGAFMAVYGGAVFVSSAVIGPLVDRSDLRRAMIASALIQGGFLAMIGVLLGKGLLGIPLLCALGAGVGLAVPLFESAVVSAIARTVEARHLDAATAVQSSTVELANIFAAALGSSMIAAAGVDAAVFANVALYVIGALFLGRVKADLASRSAPDARGEYVREWLEGVRAVFADGPLWRLFVLVAVYGVLVLPVFLLIPVLVNEVLRLPVGWVAAFEISLSIGAVLTTGSLSMLRRELHLRPVLPLLLTGTGTCLVLAGRLHTPYALVPVFALLGACYASFLTLSYVEFQHRVPEARKGRLFALLATVSTGLAPAGFLLAGVAADAFSPGAVLVAAGGGMGVLAVLSVFTARRG